MNNPIHANYYRADIDGLRAIAILLVLFHHAFPKSFESGFFGVDIFFVLSGYLITQIILKDIEAKKFSFAVFYQRRVKRIFPALILVLGFTLIMAWIWLLPEDLIRTGKHILSGAFFSANFIYWFEAGYFDATSYQKPLLHLWSLSIEEQFYLLWPALIILLTRTRQNLFFWVTLFFILSFSYNIWLVHEDPVAAFFNPLARFWEMMLGALIAIISLHKHYHDKIHNNALVANSFSILGLLLFVGLMLTLSPQRGFPGWWALAATTATALLIMAGPNASVNKYLLSNRCMVFIGLISYPLYLWHWPLLTFAYIRNAGNPSSAEQFFWVIISFLLAYLTYKLVERPIRFTHLGKIRLKTAALSAFVVSFALMGWATAQTEGSPERFPEIVQSLLTTNSKDRVTEGWRYNTCMLDYGQPASDYQDFCTEDKRPLLFIWGDSHAGSLYPAFKALQESGRYEFGIVERTGAICPPILNHEPRPLCQSLNDRAFADIQRLKPDIVFLYAWWHEGRIKGRYDLRNLDYTIQQLQEMGIKRIVLLGPVPFWRGNLPELLLQEWRRGPVTQAPPARLSHDFLDPYVLEASRYMQQKSKDLGIVFIEGLDYFCNSSGCITRLTEDDLQPISYDYGHLTVKASSYLIESIAEEVFGE